MGRWAVRSLGAGQVRVHERRGALGLLGLILLGTSGCGSSANVEEGAALIRFVDQIEEASVAGTPAVESGEPALEWRFVASEGTGGWTAGAGVEALSVEDGRLCGTTTSGAPLLTVEIPEPSATEDGSDEVHAIEVRMRVSTGSKLGVVIDDDAPNFQRLVSRLEKGAEWSLETAVVADEELHTYSLPISSSALRRPPSRAWMRHLVLRPSDEADARFEIESVRLVLRSEHLGTIDSGVAWQGLGEIYRETLVARAPERHRFSMSVANDSSFEVHMGTIESTPVTFRVDAVSETGTRVLLSRTVTQPGRWERASVELGGPDRVTAVELSLESERDGTLGFWGNPTLTVHRPPAQAESTEGPSRPGGVILLVGDTLRRDHLDAYGYERETAPHLRAMATDGVLFSRAISQGSWTKVSVSSLLTSLYQTTHRVFSTTHRMSAAADTLAESYRAAGWRTVSLPSNSFAGRMSNLHQGFETVYEPGSLESPDRDDYRSKTARATVDQLLHWLEDHREEPFFAFALVLDPHSPFEPRSPHDARWADPAEREPFRERVETVKEHIKSESMKRRGLPTREELAAAGIAPEDFVPHEIDWYDGSIRGMDQEIGRLMERLEEWGLADRTLVAFVADHGEEFLEHGRHWHGETVYGEMVNVPLLLRWPEGLPVGKVVDSTVQSIDLMPTLLELSGLEVPERAQGTSLASWLGGGSPPRSDRAIVTERYAMPGEDDPRSVDSRALVSGRWKLIHNVERPDDVPEFELYDHENDPLDLENVASENPEVVERLAARLAQWHAQAEEARLPSSEEGSAGLAPEELDRLRALGYI